MKKSFRRIAILILQIIFAICLFALAACSGSCSSCSSCSSCNKDIGNPEMPDNVTTTRKPVPTDGSKPTDHKGADTIAYLAYVLDNQPYYHAYAYNSTRAMAGYEQITQTWKEYKDAEHSGKNVGIMVASDISYSTFVKSATQSCFVDSNNDEGDAVYMRNGSKPSKNSTATSTEWSNDKPSYYSRKDYLTTYGEFSTELTVYAINADTIESTGEIIDNGDGTYSLNAKLKPDAACWYQYGMKTRGGFKSFPVYHKIELTFTFDAQWQVLTVNCEESATISPSALGGMDMSSNSKTTATYDYSEGGFDNVHYGYYDTYFDQYVGKPIINEPEVEKPGITDVLAGGFAKVLSKDGQQFGVSLTIGETEYDGNIYLKVENMEISNLEVKFALGKKDGAQDLYVEYKGGKVNAYYSDGLAATADISKVAGSVTRFADWIKTTFGSEKGEPAVQAEGAGSGIDLEGLLTLLNDGFGFDDTSAWIVLKTDDLLDLGIGIDARLDFWREITEDKKNNYGFTGLQLSEISYKGEKINVNGKILPDDGEIISHNPAEAPADIADYIDGVLDLVKGGKYEVSIDFDGTATDIEYISNVKLQANALLNLSEDYKTLYASIPVTASYSGLTVELTAYYTIDFVGGGYGTVYLNLTKIGEQDTDVKVYCDIAEAKTAVEKIINSIKGTGVQTQSEEGNTSNSVAALINKVLSLNFGAIVKEIKGNSDKIELGIGVDEILNTLDIDLGIEIGTVTLSLGLSEGMASLEGSIPALGASLEVVSSVGTVSMPDTSEYLNFADYADGADKLLSSPAYEVKLSVVNDELKLELTTSALVQLENNFNDITVLAPIFVKLGDKNNISLTAYYQIDLSNKDYGKVYLSIDGINGKPAEAKVYCDIKNTVKTVNEIIALFDKNNDVKAQSGETGKVADIISKVISINYATLIEELKAGKNGLNISVNADYLLGELGVTLGKDLTLGTLSLNLTADANNNLTLSGGLESLGADLTVKAYGKEIEPLTDLDKYANAEEYLKGAYRLIEGRSYGVSLDFDGTAIDNEYIKNVKLNGTALLNLSEDYDELSVKLPLTVTYSDLTVKLTAYYTVGFNDGNYGTVYLNLYDIGGKEVGVNIYGDISEAKTSVEQLIHYFRGINTQNDDGKAGKIANIIDTVLSLDFGAVIKEIKANPEKIELGIGADEILDVLKVNLGIKAGTVDLSLAFVDGELTLGGKASSLGLTLGVTGSTGVVVMPDPNAYANATEYIDGVYKLVTGNVYGVELNVKEEKLGLDIHSDAVIKVENNFNDITVFAPVTVTYGNYTAVLTAYYTVSLTDKNYGKVWLSFDSINEQSVGAKVYCEISETVDAVKAIIDLFDKNGNGGNSENKQSATVAEIIAKVVAIDYKTVIGQLTANNNGLNISVNANELLGAVGVTVGKNINVGTVSLKLTLDNNKKAVLWAGLDKLSAYNLNVNGSISVNAISDTKIELPDEEDYFDLNELLTVVRKAIDEAQAIIDGKDIVFTLDAALTVDGVKMQISNAYGEVDWNKGIRVAVSADLIISEIISEGENSQKLELRLIYDENKRDSETDPLVTLSVNEYALIIYGKDLTDTEEGVKEIINKIKHIADKFKTQDSTEEPAENAPAVQSEEGEEVEEVKEKSGLEKLLDIVFTEISNLTVELTKANEEDKVAQLVISYLNNATLTLGADGGLSLGLDIDNDNETQILSLNASVHAKGENEDKFEEVGKNIQKIPQSNTYAASENKSFIKVVYEYVRDVFESLTIKNLLGANTYEVKLDLYGEKSDIEALNNISVSATVRYTEVAESEKLIEINADLNINGTVVKLDAVYFNKTIYVSVNKIGDTTLYMDNGTEGLKITASEANIYKAVEAVISIIKNKNLTAIIDNMFAPAEEGTASVQSDEVNEVIPDKKTEYALTDVLNALFTLEIKFGKSEDGTQNTLTVNIDKALKAFGLGFEIGTVNVAVNPKTHDIVANVSKVTANEEGEPENVNWITLMAHTVENAEDFTFNSDSYKNYLNIDFVSDLAKDVNTTLDNMTTTTKDEEGNNVTKTDLRLSFYGEISIAIDLKDVVSILGEIGAIEFKQTTITVGFDADGEFYFTLYGQVQPLSAVVTVIKDVRWVSLTYAGGYITLGRDLNTDSPKYKVMTLDYLIDNLLVKGDNAPIRWWLGISNSGFLKVWDTIAGAAGGKVNLKSSLTKADEYYVFNPKADEEPTTKQFTLSDLINAIVVNGAYLFGNGNSLNGQLGLSEDDKYYGLDINGEKLLGSTLPTLYAAILHNDTDGISGLRAYASIAGILKPELTFNTTTKSHANNYYKTVTEKHTDIDFSHSVSIGQYEEIFGCYSSETDTHEYSKKYSDVKLTVLDGQGNVTAEKTLKYGSKVYVVKEIVYSADGESRNIYLDANGNDVTTARFAVTNEAGEETLIGYGFYITDNTVIHPATVGKNKIIYHANGQITEGISKFVGEQLDSCAVTVNGKTFAGWYLENTYETYTTSVCANKQDYYAKYVDATTTATNGIVYTFNYNFAEGGYYSATGLDKNSADKDYTLTDATLVLVNDINGYPVTKISANAFNGANIKNVVVPENITLIGANAFSNNKDMNSVVFLAQSVGLEGSGLYDNKTAPFYGCSVSGNNNSTNLNLYYNEIYQVNDEGLDKYSGADRPYWSNFYWEKSNKPRFIGHNGGSLNPISNGTWTYVKFEFEGVIPENCNYTLEQLGIDGFISTAGTYDFAGIKATAERNLNELLKVDGAPMLYEYNIVISGEYELGRIVTMRVSYENVFDASEIWYKLSIVSTDNNCSVVPSAVNMTETETENVFYVKAGEIVTFNLYYSSSYSLKECTFDVADLALVNNVITMPDRTVQVQFDWQFLAAEHVYVSSEVDFVYGSESYFAGNSVKLTNAALGEQLNNVTAYDNPETEADESALYTFVGWAIKTVGNNLQFASVTLPATESEDVTYYAIWIENRTDGVTFTNSTKSGDTIAKVTVNETGKGDFYGWYTDDKFGMPITAVTTEHTVLYARMQYTLSVALLSDNNNTLWGYNSKTGYNAEEVSSTGTGMFDTVSISKGNKVGDNNCGFNDIVITEGYSVAVYRYWSDGFIVRVFNSETLNSENCITTYLVKGFQTDGWSYRNNPKGKAKALAYDESHYFKFNNDWSVSETSELINKDSLYYKTYNSNENDLLFASNLKVNKNISFEAKA